MKGFGYESTEDMTLAERQVYQAKKQVANREAALATAAWEFQEAKTSLDRAKEAVVYWENLVALERGK